jgi:hypothetical protein
LVPVASAAAVLIAGWAVPTPEVGCAQNPDPVWFDLVVFVLGPVSIVAVFASVVALGRREGGNIIAWLIPAAVGAAIWGVVGFFALFAIVVPNGCLD